MKTIFNIGTMWLLLAIAFMVFGPSDESARLTGIFGCLIMSKLWSEKQ